MITADQPASFRSVLAPGRLVRTAVAAMTLIPDLISFTQLIYAGPAEAGRAAGMSAMLAGMVTGGLVCAVLRRGVPITLALVGAAAIVQASIAAAIGARLQAAGVDHPAVIEQTVLLACGVTTVSTGAVFALLGGLRASLIAQLLSFPVLTGFLGGVGLLFVRGGLRVGSHLD